MPRPRRPPRRARAEIKQNAARWKKKVQGGLDAVLPVEPLTEPLTEAVVRWMETVRSGPSVLAFEPLPRATSNKEDTGSSAVPVTAARHTPARGRTIDDAHPLERIEILREAGVPASPDWVLDAACIALATPFAAARGVKRARVTVANTGADALATPFALGLVGQDADENRAQASRILRTQIRATGPVGIKARLMLFLNAKAKFEAFAATGPTPAEYRDVLLEFYVPIFNAAHTSERRCLDCGQEFALRTSREVRESRHCSERCARRASKRGRERAGNGRSAVENAAWKFGKKLERHLKSCPTCGAGNVCPTYDTLFAMCNTDALDRLRGNLPDE